MQIYEHVVAWPALLLSLKVLLKVLLILLVASFTIALILITISVVAWMIVVIRRIWIETGDDWEDIVP